MFFMLLPTGFFWLFVLLSVLLHFIYPLQKIISPPYTYLGLVLIILVKVSEVWNLILFEKKKTTRTPFENPSSIITK